MSSLDVQRMGSRSLIGGAQDPVFTEDGHSYCRGCIQEWFRAHDTRLHERLGASCSQGGRVLPSSRQYRTS